jgi:hypothetical protein
MIKPRQLLRCCSTSYTALLLVLLFSIIYSIHLFGIDFIIGHSAFWSNQEGDVAQHLSGINLYLHAPWQFPLLGFNSLNYPEGTLVTFVDGIPILSFLLKLLLPQSIGWVNPLGYWLAFCFVLQGFSAWWISKELGVKSWIFLLFLWAIFLTFPEFLFRIGQVALMSQWIILFAFALYIHDAHQQRYSIYRWTFLLTAAFYIHIYLFVMVFGIYLAELFFLRKKAISISRVKTLFSFIGWLATLFVFFLPLPISHLHKSGGFGYFSMNLLSPFLGGKIIDLNSSIMPGQYEGYNYLGLGVIVLLITALLINRPMLKKYCQRHLSFLIIVILLWLFSLSNKIYVGQTLIATISYPGFTHFLLEELRSSGRFFWPVGYAISIFSLYMLYLNLRTRTFVKMVMVLLCLQLVDASGGYNNVRHMRAATAVIVINDQAYQQWLHHVKHLYYYPKYGCDKSSKPDVVIPLMRYVALHNMTLNTGYIARYTPNCDDVAEEISASDKTNSAYIFHQTTYPQLSLIYSLMGDQHRVKCHQLDYVYLCQYSFAGDER